MKQLGWLFILLLACATAQAQSQEAPANPWYVGVGTGLDLVGANWNSDYYVGGGGLGFVGYQLDKSFSLQGDAEYWVFTGAGSSVTNPRFLAELKYTFDGKGLQPYVLAGAGFDLQFATPSGLSTANPDALAGVGLQLELSAQSHLFVEARYNFTLTDSLALQDVPVIAGLWTPLP